MGDNSAIEWTEATWNPWYGCTKVSPGCAHCYMFREQRQYGRDPEIVTRSKTKFSDPLKWKEGRIIFTCSWSDWFHEAADGWRDEAWKIVRKTPQHTYQILTKRPERIASHLPEDWGAGYPNVWLGTSVENQRWTSRILPLLKIPAAIHFLSCEPLLGPIDLSPFTSDEGYDGEDFVPPLDWVIVGGESGSGARPMDLDWARTIRDQCREDEVAFFLKQLGGVGNKHGGDLAVLDGARHTEMPLTQATA